MTASFDAYLGTLQRIAAVADPTVGSESADDIRRYADLIDDLPDITKTSITAFTLANPQSVPVLGLAVGLSQEKLKNALREHLGSSGWVTLARTSPTALIEVLDREFDLLRLLEEQRARTYSFGDVLVARAGTRATAQGAANAGRVIEDVIEGVAKELGLPFALRTRFEGRLDHTAPCDLAIPAGGGAAQIVVAAKGFDSTGSKLTDAVREVIEMSEFRRPNQYVYAVIDGIGWLSRKADLQRIHDLLDKRAIDGMYTLAMIDSFKSDLTSAARRTGLL